MSVKSLNVKNVKLIKALGGPIKPIISNESVSKNQEFALGIFKPKEGLYPHSHVNSEEIYFVLNGRGTVFVGEEKKPMKISEGDVVYIPAGTVHGVTNTGRKKLMIAFFVSPGVHHPGFSIGKDCKLFEEKILFP
ncbi:MAG: cupin domain-containing protein [Nitrososphaeria archaeon]